MEKATLLKNQDANTTHNRYKILQDNDDEENITTDGDSTLISLPAQVKIRYRCSYVVTAMAET